ncbi:nucleotide exchange factor GrpE [Candidatus Woesearchaeota archaeon]|nr:nucleotide exchange factor GrpE [Candidatus Woesearchaeota archaeon]
MSEKKKSKKKEDTKEITILLKKVQADFENYQKRTEKEKQQFVEYACSDMIKDLLPILDSFELALKNTQNKDIEVLYNQLKQLLESKGLEKIKALDKKFDPFLHEALIQEASDKESGIVLEELQTGYKFKDNIIRPAKVKVSK